MYPFGHLAIGYLVGKITSELFHVDINLYVVMALSLLPDIDLLIPALSHRGPTHSILVALLLTLPFLFVIGKVAIPYALTLFSHSAIGDLITGNVKLLWPIQTRCYTFIGIPIFSPTNIALETSLFIVALLVLYRFGDYHALVQVPILSDLLSR
jgi:membrane-bound metal-dependent hydrolase YbcI (DUF457 family)